MSPVKEEDFASSSLIRFVRVRMEVMMPCHSVWPAWILLKSVRTFATRHFGSWIFASTVVPRPRPLTPRGAVVTLTPELLTRWFGLLISLSPLGYLARQRRSCSSYLICGCNMWLLVSTTKASACKLFFFFPLLSPPHFLALTRNVCSHLSAPAMAAGISILSDLSYSMSGARGGEIGAGMETGRRALQHTQNSIFTSPTTA